MKIYLFEHSTCEEYEDYFKMLVFANTEEEAKKILVEYHSSDLVLKKKDVTDAKLYKEMEIELKTEMMEDFIGRINDKIGAFEKMLVSSYWT